VVVRVSPATSPGLAEFARLAREGQATVVAEDPFDGFLTVRAGGVTLSVCPLVWWHVQNNSASGPVYLAAHVSGVRHPGL
jgi:hypothetical protein